MVNKITNSYLYIIIGYPGSGKTNYHYSLQETYCSKNINHMFFADSIVEYMEQGLPYNKALEIVRLLTESGLSLPNDYYILEDMGSLDERKKFCQLAEKLGYKIIIVYFRKPKLIMEKKYGEYVDWFWKNRNINRKIKTNTTLPFDKQLAIIKLKEFDIKFDPPSKDEQDNYKIIYKTSYSDLDLTNNNLSLALL